MDTNNSGSLEEQVGELRSRVHRLEEALTHYGMVVQEKAATPVNTPPPASPHPIAWTDAIAHKAKPTAPPMQGAAAQNTNAGPVFSYAATTSAKDIQSLESRIGSQWFNRIAIFAVLIAVAWFLDLAYENGWIARFIGPTGRILIGLAAGAAVIAGSELFRNRGYAIFSYSLKAVGSGTLYLSLWAAFSLYHLIPASSAFVAMILVTAFNVYMAWIQDAELLGLYAIVGALSTPLLVSTGDNHEITLLTYLLVLNLAVLVLVVLRPWSRLLFCAFVGTVMLFAAWWVEYYSHSQMGTTAFFLTIFFLIFAFAPRLVRVDLEDGGTHSGWDSLAVIVLPLVNAALGFVAYFALLDASSGDWAGAWLAVGFAAFYLLLLRLPAQGRLQASPPLLSSLHLTTAVVFLTIALPLKAQGRWLTIGWLVEGAALLWVASRQQLRLLRVLALLCLALGLGALLVINPDVANTPIFNERFGTYCVGIAVFAFAAWIALKTHSEDKSEFADAWNAIAAGAVIAVNALILIAVSLEIHSYWWRLRWDGNQWQTNQMSAQVSYSIWFMLFGAMLLATGFWRRTAFLRWQALLLLSVTIVKVFLFDMSALNQGYRILSFLGLGILLFGVSFVYQRDWLKLRVRDGGNDEA